MYIKLTTIQGLKIVVPRTSNTYEIKCAQETRVQN